MRTVSFHPTSAERFIDRLHEVFLVGDNAAAMKETESNNVLQLQKVYRALAEGDIQPTIPFLADDIEMELLAPAEMPISGSWRGAAEVIAAIQRNYGSLSLQQAELLSVVAQGDTVALFAEEHGQLRATDIPYHIRWVQLFTFRDAKITHVKGVAANLPEGGLSK